MGKATGSLGSLLAACVWLSYGLISPATCAAAPSPAQERPRLPLEGATSNPGWVKQPTAEEMANYYPRPAQLLGLEGKAVLECEVSVLGEAVNCKVTSETPLGMGFGDAALALAKYFQMKPAELDGAPVGGARVSIPIGFKVPPDASMPPPEEESGPPPSERALQLAHRVASAQLQASNVADVTQRVRDYLNAMFQGTSLTEQEQAALDDYVAATGASVAARTDQDAARLARIFTEQELSDIAAFLDTPSGKAWIAKVGANASELRDTATRAQLAIRDDARRRFCAAVQCLDSAAPPAPAPK